MAISLATTDLGLAARQRGFVDFGAPETHAPEHIRVLNGPTRWYAAPLCAMISHRWAPTPWSRWAFGWDREVHCTRCGTARHERARLHADLVYEGDR